jgi:diacylglycerol kinase family enzyme
LGAAGVEIGAQLVVGELDRLQAQGPIWRERGMAAAVAAGGDGTIGTVASHLAGSGLPLGILPLGTSNDTARSLGVPLELSAAAETIAAGQSAAIDAGQALPAPTSSGASAADAAKTLATGASDTPPHALGAYFLHALTLGLNVQFARLATDVARRQRFGRLTYAASALEAVATYRPVTVTLRFSGLETPDPADQEPNGHDRVVTCRVAQVAVVNAPVFGGARNLRLPDVRVRDALLDLVVLEALDPPQLRQTVEALLAAQPDEAPGLAVPGIRRYKAQAMQIESERPLDVTVDGEVRSRTPVLVRVTTDMVRVYLPPEAHAALA